jgi:type I restriction enzyme R subunit
MIQFDTSEINVIADYPALLKLLCKAKIETKLPEFLALLLNNFDDTNMDNLIKRFRDKERRKEFFKEYKEIEMLYEMISPDAFVPPVH